MAVVTRSFFISYPFVQLTGHLHSAMLLANYIAIKHCLDSSNASLTSSSAKNVIFFRHKQFAILTDSEGHSYHFYRFLLRVHMYIASRGCARKTDMQPVSPPSSFLALG
jgi:hypothetical protein